jgi:hypothetical protein
MIETKIVIDDTEQAKAFFKELLCLPDEFHHQTIFGKTIITFKGIDKIKLYRDLYDWLDRRLP